MNNQIPEALSGSDWWERLAEASLIAFEDAQNDAPAPPLLTVTLGRGPIDIFDTAVVTQAIQKAVGKIGYGIRNPAKDRTATYRTDRESTRMVPIGQSGTTLFFGFPTYSTSGGLNLADGHFETLAQGAIHELLTLLPATTDDDVAVDAILAQRPTARSAANDLVRAVRDAETDLDLRFEAPGREPTASVLSFDQARVLHDSLSEVKVERHTERHSGLLDGVRTSRRIFYIQPDDMTEIHGAVDGDLMRDVYSLMGRNVDVELEVAVSHEKSGRISRPRYRLLSVAAQQSPLEGIL